MTVMNQENNILYADFSNQEIFTANGTFVAKSNMVYLTGIAAGGAGGDKTYSGNNGGAGGGLWLLGLPLPCGANSGATSTCHCGRWGYG